MAPRGSVEGAGGLASNPKSRAPVIRLDTYKMGTSLRPSPDRCVSLKSGSSQTLSEKE